MVQVGKELSEGARPSNSIRDWSTIEEIVRELAEEKNENRLTVLTQRLLEALGEEELFGSG